MHKLEKVWIVIVWNIGTDVDNATSERSFRAHE